MLKYLVKIACAISALHVGLLPIAMPNVARAAQTQSKETLKGTATPVSESKARRLAPKNKAQGVPSGVLKELPSEEEIFQAGFLPEPLVPVPGASSDSETRALTKALRKYQAGAAEDIQPLADFVQTYSESRWTPGLLLNLGAISYRTGYFSKALEYWHAAWEKAKEAQDIRSRTIANQGIAEYAKMCARVGRKDELVTVFEEVAERQFTGNARVKMDGAREGYWTMLNKPQVAFRCGPYALTAIEPLLKSGPKSGPEFLKSIASPPTGFSLNEVAGMAQKLGLNLQMAKRTPGAAVIFPSVVHWKVGHFGALVREFNGNYLLQDPTFGNETWLTAKALDAESSGYFLVPLGKLPHGWTLVNAEEGSDVFGKGHSGGGGEEDTSKKDHRLPPCPKGIAMTTYSFHTLLASLSITDTPVGYSAAYGSDVYTEVTYNQREAGQPTAMDYTNFSPRWVTNWVSYLKDNPTNAAANVILYERGGGSETYTGFNATTQSYKIDVQSATELHRLTANTYEKRYSDGSREIYAHYIGTSGSERKVFLSEVIDPQGNSVTLEYDTTYPTRLKYIHDALGLTTEYSYDLSGSPFLVTSVGDPYGRTALFTYNVVNDVTRLISIEDVYGIVSSLEYDDEDGIVAMTTPYGTTTFELSPFKIGQSYDLIRYIEATDPYGNRERVEYNLSTQQTGVSAVSNEIQPDPAKVYTEIYDNDDRNSFYWDKQMMRTGAGSHAKAHLFHWTQPGSADSATSILESEKPPMEGRIWYSYPGQTGPSEQGTLAKPSVIARVVYDESGLPVTQVVKKEYNALGNVTRHIDPLGRETVIEYDTNGIDIRFIKQKTGETGGNPVYTKLAEFTYDSVYPAHCPKTFTDTAGQITTYTYTTEGQIETVENPLDEIITFTYETNPALAGYGKVKAITGDVSGGDVTYAFDAYDRIDEVTDSEGHTTVYAYDDLDRVTVITYPDTSFEQFDYENHSLVRFTDREGRVTHHTYNKLNQLVATRDPAGRLTQFEWCLCGAIRKIIDGEMNVTQFLRDLQGRVAEKRYSDGTSEFYTYDAAGRLATAKAATEQIKTFSYYLDNRLKEIDYSDAATADVSYTYDTYFERVATMTDGIGLNSYAYHPLGSSLGAGQLARVNGPFSDDTAKYTYDELGRLKKWEVVDDATYSVASHSEEYDFDARGRIENVLNRLGTFELHHMGQSSRADYIDYPNGQKIDYDYFGSSGDFLLKQIKNLAPGVAPAVLSQFDYTYRQDRSIATWTTEQGGAAARQWVFGYDAARQLTYADRLVAGSGSLLESRSYAYDLAGNRINVNGPGSDTRNYEANTLNQLTEESGYGRTLFSGTLDEPASIVVNGESAKVTSTAGTAPYRFESWVDLVEGANTVEVAATDGNNNTTTKTYSVSAGGATKILEYDLRGNLRYERNPNQTVIREFEWDQENRLIKITAGTHQTEFVYDGLSRRVRIVEKENSVETASHVYLWSGTQICQKRDAAGSAVMRDYYASGFTEGGDLYYYTRDHLGSIREITDEEGDVRAFYDYDVYGAMTKLGGDLDGDFGFTGFYWHAASGLNLSLYRAYDSELGRWLSRDPIGENGGLNLYGYVFNNPINLIDPLGLAAPDGDPSFTKFLNTKSAEEISAARQKFVNQITKAEGLLKDPKISASYRKALEESIPLAKQRIEKIDNKCLKNANPWTTGDEALQVMAAFMADQALPSKSTPPKPPTPGAPPPTGGSGGTITVNGGQTYISSGGKLTPVK